MLYLDLGPWSQTAKTYSTNPYVTELAHWRTKGSECFFSPSEEKAEMMEALHRTDNDYFLWLSILSKRSIDFDEGFPTWMDFEIHMRKARPFLLSQGTMIWYQLLTYLTRFSAVAVFTHPLRISRFILFHKISGRDTNYMWHHIVKTLSRTVAWKEALTGGRRRWKEAPGCHSESIVDFFFKTQRAL